MINSTQASSHDLRMSFYAKLCKIRVSNTGPNYLNNGGARTPIYTVILSMSALFVNTDHQSPLQTNLVTKRSTLASGQIINGKVEALGSNSSTIITQPLKSLKDTGTQTHEKVKAAASGTTVTFTRAPGQGRGCKEMVFQCLLRGLSMMGSGLVVGKRVRELRGGRTHGSMKESSR